MACRLLAVAMFAGCSFQPGTPAGGAGGSPTDATSGAGSDDALAAADAMTDAGSVTHGSLTVTPTIVAATNLDLTSAGSTDWVHWGLKTGSTGPSGSGFDRMVGGSAISALAALPTGGFDDSRITSSWTNGMPDAGATATNTGVYVSQGTSMQFTVAATTTKQTLRLYTLTQQCDSRLAVALSDDSAPAGSGSRNQPTSSAYQLYTIGFNAATAGQQLNVTWSDANDSGLGNGSICGLIAATLE